MSYNDDIYDCVQANVVALTFDDGPLQYTAQLLDILKQYSFTATFFITGNNIGKGAIDGLHQCDPTRGCRGAPYSVTYMESLQLV